MNKWMFFKRVDDVMPAAYFFKQKHVQFTINKWNSSKQKQEQRSFVNVFDGPRGFLNEKSL